MLDFFVFWSFQVRCKFLFLLILTTQLEGGGRAASRVPEETEDCFQSFKHKTPRPPESRSGVIATSEDLLKLSMVGWRVKILDLVAQNIHKTSVSHAFPMLMNEPFIYRLKFFH